MSVEALNVVTEEAFETVTPEAYREGMASLAAAVNVVTAQGPEGKVGFTATAVTSVSDNPATLLVCLNRNSSVHKAFEQSRYLAINTLANGQDSFSNLFAGKVPMAERFEEGKWSTLSTGSPILNEAAVSFDCIVTEFKSVATHDVIFCQVVDIKQNAEAGSLLYCQRKYHSLEG